MKRSIATVSLSGGLEDKLVAAAKAGFDGVELFEPDLIACPLSPAEVRARLDELGLEVSLYQPLRDFEGVSGELLSRNLRRAERKFAVMEALGAELILVCSSVHEEATDDDRLAAAQLRQLAESAAQHDVRVAYEALAWGRHVDRFEHSWRIVERADHPNLGVCLDSFHILARGDDPRAIREIPGDKIFYLQLADAPRLAMDVLQWSRHHRSLPWQGELELVEFMTHVLATGYDGPLSLEVFNDILRQAEPRRTAVDAMRSLVVLEDRLADRLGSAGPPASARLQKLPPAPSLDRYAFVELGVDAVSEPLVEGLLTALGFHQAGLDRSKPVELWRNGEVHMVVNRDVRATPEHASGLGGVGALAFETPDPAGGRRRADLLLAPTRRCRGPREAELEAITAPDGISVFMCDTPVGEARDCLDDFIAPNLRRAADPQLTGIDHVALSQPFECFDQARLFYRAVLGLEPQPGHDLAAPHGLVRSQALANRGGRVRVVLNVPALGGGSSPTPDVQHVAFGCRDIFSSAEALRGEAGAVLPITDNYYDDLAARLNLDDDLLERIRALGICYDRDGRGEFLHLYTKLAGPRLFFELVERRGGYDGYGAANSGVRMAAQRASLQVLGVA